MNGCVYKISSLEGDCCYIGRTTKPIRQYRYTQHKYEFRTKRYYYSSFEVMKYPDVKFEVIEDDIPREQLRIKEMEYILNTPKCVNIR